ncbi:hypothetical protein U5A82_20500 [Sphingobium sp. CR2-8]|uniref:hypothetical protein n=1 Tax=Sphingobium sp. CR2-8 TaxID=1306534 RepID=UPI002DBEE22F|nr:hypothetical protein [Sphingobium sp. CR2-8]MEC3912765.1 hypothetical protein [Sphingobium sp. CR2-8]
MRVSVFAVALMVSATGSAQARPMIGEDVARAQWDMAENRAQCAPLALLSDGGMRGKARPAQFSGGWAVAFDLPGVRSAYGFAGPGIIAMDSEPDGAQRARLAKQWPHQRTLNALPRPAFAGYGLVGAEPYPAANPQGKGLQSLAYLQIGGQRCTYNVWSRISRAHLETLLDHLLMQD